MILYIFIYSLKEYTNQVERSHVLLTVTATDIPSYDASLEVCNAKRNQLIKSYTFV